MRGIVCVYDARCDHPTFLKAAARFAVMPSPRHCGATHLPATEKPLCGVGEGDGVRAIIGSFAIFG